MKNVKRWLALILAITLVGSNALYQLGTSIRANETENVAVTEPEESPSDEQQVKKEEQPVVSEDDGVVIKEVEPEKEETPVVTEPEEPKADPEEKEDDKAVEEEDSEIAMEEQDAEKTSEVKMPAQTLNDVAGNIKVTLTAEEGVLPEGTTMKAEPVSKSSVEDAVNAQLAGEGKKVVDIVAADITLYDKEGNEIQPNGEVTVTFDNVISSNEAQSAAVFHVADSKKSAEKVKEVTVKNKRAGFKANHFSVYAVATLADVKAAADNQYGIITGAIGGSGTKEDPWILEKGKTATITIKNSSTKSSPWSTQSKAIRLLNKIKDKVDVLAWEITEEAKISYSGSTSNREFYVKVVGQQTIEECKVTFNPNGGAGNTYSTVLSEKNDDGNFAMTLPDPADIGITNEGKVFVGWSTQANGQGSNFVAGIEHEFSTTTVMYAIWMDPNSEDGKNEAFFYVRKNGVIQYEPSSYEGKYYYPLDEDKRNLKGTLKKAIAVNNNLAAVEANLATKPSDLQIKDMLNLYGVTFDPETQYVQWYVIKYRGAKDNITQWNVDGVIRYKSKYVVTYITNGGNTNVPGSIEYSEGQTVQIDFSKIPSRAGYEFLGWDTNVNAETPIYSQGATPNSFEMPKHNVTLYAIWQAKDKTEFNVNHYIGSGNDYTSYTLIEKEIKSGKTDSTIISSKYTKNIPGYRFVHADPETTVINGDGTTDINLYYEIKTDLSYTVKYLEKDTNTVLNPEKAVANQTFGNTVTETAVDITGYIVDEKSKSIQIQDGTNEIIFYYEKREDLSYTINYLEQETDAVLAPQEVVNRQTFGASVTVNAIEINGYSKVDPTEVTITIAETGNVINFYYTKRNDLGYTVKYLDKDTNIEVATQKDVTGKTFKEEVTEYAINVIGYNKVDPTTAIITIGTGTNEIIFYYTKKNDLSYTVNYYEEGTTNKVAESKMVNGKTFKEEVTESAIDVAGYNKVAPTSATLTISADERQNVINFYYTKRTDLSYTVNYYEEGTTNKVAESKVVENRMFGEAVTENAIDVVGYNKVEPTSKTITIAVENKVINFYYKKKADLSYTVRYLETGTDNVLKTAKIVENKTYKETVTETAPEIKGYILVGDETESLEIGVDNSKNVITFYYTKKDQLSYVVKYLDEDTNAELHSPKAVAGQIFGTKITEMAIDIAGYSKVAPTSVTITIDDETANEIIFYYTKRTDLSYTVNYYEEGTTNTVATAKTVPNQTFGASVTETAIDVSGYNKVEPTSTTITIKVSGNEINFYYTKRTDLSYTVNYYEEGTTNKVAESKTVNGKTFKEEVTETAIDVSGYNKVEPTSTTITIKVSGNEINFYYTKRTDLSYTVNYLEQGTNKALENQKVVGGQTFGETVIEHAINIEGYTVVQASDTITINVSNNVINFYYTKRENLSYTVNYYEEGTTNKVAESKKVNGKTFKEEVTESAIDIAGYNKVAPTSTELIISADESKNVINFYYEKRTDLSYTVNYYEEGTTNKVAESKKVNGKTFKEEVTESAIDVAGYNKVAPTSATLTISADESQNVINFYYTKRTDLSYTVNYYEEGTTNKVAESKVVENRMFGEAVTENAIDVVGYNKVEPTSKTITIAVENNVINFYYEKKADLSYTVRYLETGTDNVLKTAKIVENKTYKETVTETAPEIKGYILVGDETESLEIGVDNSKNVITFYYTKKDQLSYVVKYLDEDTNAELHSPKAVAGQIFGTEITEMAIDIAGYSKVAPTSVTITIDDETANEIIFYYEKRTDLSYTVNYYEEGTTNTVATAKTVPNQTFGASVTETAIDVSGYNKVEPTSTTITIKVSGNEINFYYTKRTDLSYTVNYYEEGTTNKVAESKTVNGKTFKEEVTETAIDVSGYNKVEPTSATITIKVSGNEINFYYTKRTDLSYTVKYLEAGTNKELADVKTVDGQTFDAEVTENAINIDGYNVVGDAQKKIKIAVKDNEIIFYYAKRTDLAYVVNYLEKGTNKVLADAKTITKQKFEDTVKENAIAVDGYVAETPTSKELTISADNSKNVINFYYTKRTDLSYSVEYLEEDTNEVLSPTEVVQNKTFKEKVTETAIDINGYNKVDPTSKTITIGTGDNVIKFYYTKRTDLSYTVNYLEQGTDKVVAPAKVVNNKTFKEEVTENAIAIDGYNKVDPTSKTVTIAVENNVINFYYTKCTDLSYTVNYLEQGTNKVLADVKTVDGQTFDAEVTENAINIDGYNKVDPTSKTITIGVNENVITFYYTKKTDLSYTVKYLEAETNKELADVKTVDGQTFDAEVTENAINIDGYNVVGDAQKKIKIAVKDNEIIFYYAKRTDLAYVVNYLEKGTNKVLADAKTVDDQTFGTSVTETAINIDGYKKVTPDSVTIMISSDNSKNEINFYYEKRTDLSYTVNYLEKGTDKLLALAKKVDNKKFEDKISENAIEIAGYDKVEPSTAELIISTDSAKNVINFYYTKRVDLSYTVEYYLDNVLASDLGYTVDGQTFEAVVNRVEDKKPAGYMEEKVENLPLTIGTDIGSNVIKVYYAKDVISEGSDPDEPDGIPDRYQVVVNYRAVHGTVDLDKTVVTLRDEEGKFSETGKGSLRQVATATADQYYNQDSLEWSTETPVVGMTITEARTFTATFEAQRYHVYYDANGGTGTVTDDDTYVKDTTVTAKANGFKKDNATFAYWKNGNDIVNAKETFTMPAKDVTLVAQWKSITVDKQYEQPADTNYKLGEVIKFTISVTNSGDVDLTDVVVTDELAGAVIKDGKGYKVAGNKATIGTLKVKETVIVEAEYTVTEADLDNDNFTNKATATDGDTTGTDETPEIPMDKVKKQLTVIKSVTNLEEATGEKDGDKVFALGDKIKFDIVVKNTGNQTLKDIEVEDGIADAVIVNGDGYKVVENKAVVTELKPGEEVTVKAEYEVQEADLGNAQFRNTATAKADGTEGGGDTPPIPVDDRKPGLEVKKTVLNGKDEYEIGDVIKYQIVVTNTGNVTLENIEVTDALQNAAGKVTNIKVDGAATDKMPTIKTLAQNEKVTITCEYTVQKADRGEVIKNTATATDVNGTTGTDETPGENVEEVYDIYVNHVFAAGEGSNIALPEDYVLENKAVGYNQVLKAEAVEGYVAEPLSHDVTIVDDDVYVTFTYSRDTIGEGPDPDEPDGIPDRYQVIVNFVAINGTVSFRQTVVTLYDENGNYSETGTGTLNRVAAAMANKGYNQRSLKWASETPVRGMIITGARTFTATFTAIPVVPVVPTEPDGTVPPTRVGRETPLTTIEAGATIREVFQNEDGEVPLGNQDLGHKQDHKCCILHFLLMLLALIVLMLYTRSMKKHQEDIFELREELETELKKRGLSESQGRE